MRSISLLLALTIGTIVALFLHSTFSAVAELLEGLLL